jgi:hypothetical protein
MTTHRRCLLAGMSVAFGLLAGAPAQGSTIYLDGVSPALSGAFTLGTHLPNYIGPTVEEGNGTALDGTRVYIFDVNGAGLNPLTATPFNLLVWQFGSARDSVRLYTHQDHYFGGPVNDSLAPEVLEYSVWGCNGDTADLSAANDCRTQGEWTMLSDPINWSFATPGDGEPIYTFAGLDPAAVIYRGGSTEFGLVNAYVQDFTFASGYNFYAIRGSSIAMHAITADPELDAMAAFDRSDVPLPGTSGTGGGGGSGVPEPTTLLLVGSGVAVLVRARR